MKGKTSYLPILPLLRYEYHWVHLDISHHLQKVLSD